jgi:4-amino-4-deoxy-L-arabinose transferase-like glycosyltransferase
MKATDASRALRWSHGVAVAVLVIASLWFAFAAAWGLFGLLPAGHLGAGSAGNAMAAEQMLRWKIVYPAWAWYENAAPQKSAYICHHPFGQYYFHAFFLWIFGHRDFAVRLPAVLMSIAMPPLLFGIAKERWGVGAGAVAAAAYAVVPIALGFSCFMNLETVCIFGTLLFFWGHSRYMATGRRRYLAASLAGLVVACSGDWVGYVLVAPALAWSFLRAFVLPARVTPRLRLLPYARWWAVAVAICAVTAVVWMGLFFRADAIADWLAQGSARGGGESAKLHDVLEARKYWIDFCFTPLAIRLGKLAAPICLLRLLLFRCDEEVYSLSILVGAVFQYVAFKQGADVHIFWPHYFAPYYALAIAQVAHLFSSGAGWVAGRWFSGWRAAVASWAVLVVGLFPSLVMARDGVKSVWVWRQTGGRYDDNGATIRSNVVADAHVRVYGDLWVVDQRERAAPVDAFSMNEREPNLIEWLLWNPTERHRLVGDQPDPWLTWEWRLHLGQAATEPTGEPKTIDEMRIAHNAAVARGDVASAERWRERIDGQIDRQVVARFGDSLRLVGVRVVGGAEPRVESWFEVLGPLDGDATFQVHSTIVDKAPFSLIPADKVDRQMASVSSIPTKLWRRGFLYKIETDLDHRIGSEQYLATWASMDGTAPPRRSDGKPDTLLVTMN